MESIEIQGKLLLASPQLVDPNFVHSVVLIVRHGDDGALGLIINRPLETTVREVIKDEEGPLTDCDEVLHQGGPCDGPLMVVHTHEPAAQLKVMEGLYFSTDKDSIEGLSQVGVEQVKYFVGYSGWSPGQLESEIKSGGWMVVPTSRKVVFENRENLWMQLITQAALGRKVKSDLIPPDVSVN